jgi:HAD superfamily hydrolase (TIGR01509 family)
MRLPALIFDFGNVVAFFDYQKACDRLAARLGQSGEAVRKELLEQGFAQTLARFEAGQMTSSDFAASVTARLGLSLDFDDFVRDWEDIFWLNEPVSRLIASLKSRGYTLILGSNTNLMHALHFRRKFAATLDLFDALVLSYEVGCLKPDVRFYEACASAAGARAGSCVFIDDLAENVEGARNAGLLGVHYQGDGGLIASLQALGVEILPGE